MAEYNFPNNSIASKGTLTTTKQDPPKPAKVVQNAVELKKPTKSEKLKEDAKNSMKSVMANTIGPGIKNMILNALWSGLSMIFFPDGSHRPSDGYSPASRIYYGQSAYNNYGSYYKNPVQPRTVNISEPAFRNPILGTMQDASAVIDAMRDTIHMYGFATWGTLYDLCGMDSANWQGTAKYGWTSVEATTIQQVTLADGRMGFELRMPKASPIDG